MKSFGKIKKTPPPQKLRRELRREKFKSFS
jgi:hypothetical protein